MHLYLSRSIIFLSILLGPEAREILGYHSGVDED
jgi:hypothetical protein